jgi:hypothetical protein
LKQTAGRGEESMANLIKEDRYIYLVGTTKHFLHVQELVWGSSAWPGRFHIQVRATREREGKNFYGKTALEVVQKAIEYLYCHPVKAETTAIELNRSN